MTRFYLRGYALRATDDDQAAEDGPIPFVLATEGRKADGLDLKMTSLDLERYQSNPVLGYGHMYWGRESLPIGRVDDPRVDDGRLVGGLVFDRDDEFAAKVERKVRNRFLNAVSVGFDAHDIGDDGVPARWELFETSVVPLPMDPDAVAEDEGRALALARALGADLRAGAVLSKKNKKLVGDAVSALQALMDAAGGTDDDTTDDGRQGAAVQPHDEQPGQPADAEVAQLRAQNEKLRRLAGLPATA